MIAFDPFVQQLDVLDCRHRPEEAPMASLAIDAENVVRHRAKVHLIDGARDDVDIEEVAGVCGMHATRVSDVDVAAVARSVKHDRAASDRALYEDRTLVRVYSVRRAQHVVPAAGLHAFTIALRN